MRAPRFPDLLVIATVTVVAFIGAELALYARSWGAFGPATMASFLSSIFFVGVFGVLAHRLRTRDDVSPERYGRMARWIATGATFFVLFFSIGIWSVDFSLPVAVGLVRWALVTGGGSGLLIGYFEARAIDQALQVERTQIRNEELSRQNDRLEEFADVVAHDLRNPLNVASGQIKMHRKECESERLDVGATALDRMREIIEDTLTLARSGKVIEAPEHVDLGTVAERAWESVETDQASLTVADSAWIESDFERAQQLFENLYRNAIEHAGDAVKIRVGTLSGGFYVEDDGPGIPADERESVFQAGYSTTDEGTGFGLAIVKQIATAHGWRIAVTESPAGGARFEFTACDVERVPTADSASGTLVV